MTRRRLDNELVRRGLASSRARARDVVLEGQVLVSGSIATKPGRMVAPAEAISLRDAPMPYVSRGGRKLDAALEQFRIDPSGQHCLDVGASTGGFTDRLLQGGAAGVVAVDVGRNQLDWRLRSDSRVRSLERTDIRRLDEVGAVDLVTVDVSFIALRTVLPAVVDLAPSAPIVGLVKPQFEIGRSNVAKGGVVRDPGMHRRAIELVADEATRLSRTCVAATPSPITGAEGNREFFVHLTP